MYLAGLAIGSGSLWDDKKTSNGKTPNTGILRFAQDDDIKPATATADSLRDDKQERQRQPQQQG
jgi:hypothetical protein